LAGWLAGEFTPKLNYIWLVVLQMVEEDSDALLIVPILVS
jgi:hypothetical protein